jgi:hypothetical protein
VCAYFAPAFVYGGPPRSVLALCRAQRDAGADVRVVTTSANGDGEVSEEFIARGEYEGIPVRYCSRAWPRSIFYAPSLAGVVENELRDADILHIHACGMRPSGVQRRPPGINTGRMSFRRAECWRPRHWRTMPGASDSFIRSPIAA